MREAAVVLAKEHRVLRWHLPPGRTVGHLPDSKGLWACLWENREVLLGVAHSHPGFGRPTPSWEDLTTFSAVELALGRRLYWWITSEDQLVLTRWIGPSKYDYFVTTHADQPRWLAPLRAASEGRIDSLDGLEER